MFFIALEIDIGDLVFPDLSVNKISFAASKNGIVSRAIAPVGELAFAAKIKVQKGFYESKESEGAETQWQVIRLLPGPTRARTTISARLRARGKNNGRGCDSEVENRWGKKARKEEAWDSDGGEKYRLPLAHGRASLARVFSRLFRSTFFGHF